MYISARQKFTQYSFEDLMNAEEKYRQIKPNISRPTENPYLYSEIKNIIAIIRHINALNNFFRSRFFPLFLKDIITSLTYAYHMVTYYYQIKKHYN